MKKAAVSLVTLLLMLALPFSAYASVRVGVLTKSNVDDGEYNGFISTEGVWKNLSGSHSKGNVVVFYDSITSMLMALNAGSIDEMDLPGIVGNYVLSTRPDCKITCIVRTKRDRLAFGFLKDRGEALRDKFNTALSAMDDDGTLRKLKERYLKAGGDPESVEFEKFNGAETIRVAVTGDLPPIDYVAMDGKAAGFNAALLAEIASRLEVNVSLSYIDTGARASALASGRADVIFWYQITEGQDIQYDIPDSVILSRPYYDWDTFVHIGRK